MKRSKNNSIKVLHISANMNGGVGAVVKNICRHFKSCLSITLYGESTGDEKIFRQYKALKNNLRLLISKVDVLHFHGSWLPHIRPLLAPIFKPTLISIHGSLHKESLKKSRTKKIFAKYLYMRRVYSHALTMTEVNDIHNFGVRNTPIAVIPNGLDFEEELPVDNDTKVDLFKITRGKRVVLSLSRLDRLKGLDMLVESFRQVCGDDAVLLIAGGGDDRYRDELEARVKSLKLSQSIYFLGEVHGAQKNAVYEAADLFVLPSFNEGFGITVLEAYRQKIPVITTTSTPFNELSENGVGWYIPPETDDIVQALGEALVLGKSDLAKMGQEGFEIMKVKYSLDEVNNKIELLYQWLISGGDSPDFVKFEQ